MKKAGFAALAFLLIAPVAFADLIIGPYVPNTSPQLDFTFALDPAEVNLAILNDGDALTTVNIETAATDFSASGWFEGIAGGSFTNLFADQKAKTHVITLIPGLKEALEEKVKENNSEDITFVVYLSADGKSATKNQDFKIRGVLPLDALKMQYKSNSMQSTPANQGTVTFYKKEDFSIVVSGLKEESDKSLFLFRNQNCAGSPARTVSYTIFKDAKAYEWQGIGWQGVSGAEQSFCACQAKAQGECAAAGIAYKASITVRESKPEEDSILWALAQIDKKLVEGIFK